MALSADPTNAPAVKDSRTQAEELVASSTVYLTSLVARLGPYASANQGKAQPFTASANEVPEGHHRAESRTGSASAFPVPKADIDTYVGINQGVSGDGVPVTGVTGAADVNKLFYYADDGTRTLTKPTLGWIGGRILKHVSGTNCWVEEWRGPFGVVANQAFALRREHLLSLDLANALTGKLLTDLTWRYRGEFVGLEAVVETAPAGAGASLDLSLTIGANAVTGGVVTVSTGDAQGAIKSGTSITASTAQVHEGDLVDVDGTLTNSFSAGRISLYAIVRPQLGL